MTDNEKRTIAKMYPSNAEAIGLLNVLVKSGYECILSCTPGRIKPYEFRVFNDVKNVAIAIEPTIHEAIVSAVTSIIEEEIGND